jgi:inner membrane transporter RhtA
MPFNNNKKTLKKFTETLFYPILLIIASMVSLTSGASLAKNLFPALGAEGTTFLRLGIAALLLICFWRPWRMSLNKLQFKIIVAYGVCLGLMNFLFYLAIARLPLGIAIAVEFIGPLSVALFLSRRSLDFFWAALAILGIVLILPLSENQTTVDPIGLLYALAAAAMWALYIILGKKAGNLAHAGQVTSWGMLAGCIAVSPLGLTKALPLFSNNELLLSALGVGILSSALPYSLEMIALKKIDSKNFGILMSMEPAIGALAGFIFLGENLNLIQSAAILFIIAASAGSSIFSQKRSAPTIIPTP